MTAEEMLAELDKLGKITAEQLVKSQDLSGLALVNTAIQPAEFQVLLYIVHELVKRPTLDTTSTGMVFTAIKEEKPLVGAAVPPERIKVGDRVCYSCNGRPDMFFEGKVIDPLVSTENGLYAKVKRTVDVDTNVPGYEAGTVWAAKLSDLILLEPTEQQGEPLPDRGYSFNEMLGVIEKAGGLPKTEKDNPKPFGNPFQNPKYNW